MRASSKPILPARSIRSPRKLRTEAVLNHVSGHRKGVAGIYNRSLCSAEKKAALDMWGPHIAVLLAQADGSNVRPLKPAKRVAAK
jgi:hypothetical protein